MESCQCGSVVGLLLDRVAPERVEYDLCGDGIEIDRTDRCFSSHGWASDGNDLHQTSYVHRFDFRERSIDAHLDGCSSGVSHEVDVTIEEVDTQPIRPPHADNADQVRDELAPCTCCTGC